MHLDRFRHRFLKRITCEKCLALATYTFLIAGSVWAYSYTIFYTGPLEQFETQVNSFKSTSEMYKAKSDLLQKDIDNLREEKNKLESWLMDNDKSFPYLVSKIKKVETELLTCQSQLGATTPRPAFSPASISVETEEYPKESKDLVLGQTFIDPTTGIVVGVNEITTSNLASGSLTLPGSKSESFKNISPGKSWDVTKNDKKYKVILSEANWLRNSFGITIIDETPKSKTNSR